MSEAEFSIHTPTDDVLTLDQAVLLYHGRSGGALATVHEILTVDGAPVIGAGRAMTAQAARELASALLQRAAHGGFLPETVLYVHGDVLVWWAPSAVAITLQRCKWSMPLTSPACSTPNACT